MRRTARALTIGAVLAVSAMPAPALAKVPPLTVEWSPRAPAVGQEVTFTVRFWDDVGHTNPARWVDEEFVDDLLWVAPSSAAASGAIRLELAPERPGVFRGRIAFPTPGAWSVCMWKASCRRPEDAPGYPGRLELIVGGDATAPAAADVVPSSTGSRDLATAPSPKRSGSSSLPAAAAVVAVAVGALAVGIRRAGSRRASPERSGARTR